MSAKTAAAVNALTTELIKDVGLRTGLLGDFGAEMIVIEGLVAGLIGSAALRYNRHPDEIVAALTAGIKERTEYLIYGPKQ